MNIIKTLTAIGLLGFASSATADLISNGDFEDDLGELSEQVRPIWMDKIYHSTDTFWFDDINSPDHYDTRNDIALEALLKTLFTIRSSDTTDNAQSKTIETWGDRHTLTIRHPMAAVPFIGSLLNLQFGPWPWSGIP